MYLFDRVAEFAVSRPSVLRIAVPAVRMASPSDVRARSEKVSSDDLRDLIKNDLQAFIRNKSAHRDR
jgi:hypothetical protein